MAWNGSSEKNTNGTSAAKRPVGGAKKSPSIMRGAFAALAVVALAAGAWWWLARRAPEPVAPERPKRPAKAPLPAAEKPTPQPKPKDYSALDNIQLRRLPESETNNLTEAQVKYWRMFHPWPPPDKDQPKAKHGKYHIFETRADNEIAFVLATEPGTMVIGNRSVGPDFESRFLKSLEKPIIVSKDDSEYEQNLKRAVIEAKLNLKDALDRGEDIGKIMDEARAELQKLARYRAQLEKEATVMLHRGEIGAADAEDVIKAVNKMLEEKGIAPIELNSMSRLAMKYQNIVKKESEQ
ncbi:MAG: hypothetical protein IJG18_13205 [Kiritimatiellae bacterium]|nr:hypothetical protein [Kiritimatiellia bacterium]